MAKFTFKKHRPTGPYRSFELDYTDIKLKRKVCGSISQRRSDHTYGIGFMKKKEPTKECPANFKWVWLKGRSPNEDHARERVKNATEWIQENIDLYLMED